MLWLVLCVLSLANASDRTVPSISDAIRTGATMVLRFLNPSSSQAFSSVFTKLTEDTKVDRKGDEDGGYKFILLVLRLLGVDNQRVTDFAFEGIISLVQLMNRILIDNNGNKRKEKAEFSLFRFILSQPKVNKLLTQIQDPKLVDLILEESEEKLKNYPEENVDCIKVLICRTKPFVREMQRSLEFFTNRENIKISEKETCGERAHEETCHKEDEDAWDKADLEARMYFFVPSLEEVAEYGDKCDRLFPNCLY